MQQVSAPWTQPFQFITVLYAFTYEQEETPLLFSSTPTPEEAAAQAAPLGLRVHMTEGHPMMAEVDPRYRQQVVADVNARKGVEQAIADRRQELFESHKLMTIDHPALLMVEEPIRAEVLAEIHLGRSFDQAVANVQQGRMAAQLDDQRERNHAGLEAGGSDEERVEPEAAQESGRVREDLDDEGVAYDGNNDASAGVAEEGSDDPAGAAKSDAGGGDAAAEDENAGDDAQQANSSGRSSDAGSSSGTDSESDPTTGESEAEQEQAEVPEGEAASGGGDSDDDDVNRDDAAGREQRDAGADSRQNKAAESDDESEAGSDPESTTDESDDEQTSTSESETVTTSESEGDSDDDKSHRDEAGRRATGPGAEGAGHQDFNTPRKQTTTAGLGSTRASPGKRAPASAPRTRGATARENAAILAAAVRQRKLREKKRNLREKREAMSGVQASGLQGPPAAAAAPSPSVAAKPQAAAEQKTAKPTVNTNTVKTQYDTTRLAASKKPSLLPEATQEDSAGKGCWWTALRPMLELVDPQMATWFVPARISRVGDPMQYIMRERLHCGKGRAWLETDQQAEHELVRVRDSDKAKLLSDIMCRGTIVGVVFYQTPSSANANLGHYTSAVRDSNGVAVCTETGTKYEEMHLHCSLFDALVDMVVVKRKTAPAATVKGKGQKPETGAEAAAKVYDKHLKAASQGEAGAQASEVRNERKSEGIAKAAVTRAANAAAAAATPAAASPAAAAGASAPVGGQATAAGGAAQKSVQEKLDALPFRTNVVRFLPNASVPEVRRYFIAAFDGVKGCLDSTKKLTLPSRNRGRTIAAQAAGKSAPGPERRERPAGGYSVDTLVGSVEYTYRRGNKGKAFQKADSVRTRIEDGEEPDIAGKLGLLHPKADQRDTTRTAPTNGMVLTTDVEVLRALTKIAKDKAPGPSGMTSDVLAQVVEYEHTHGGSEVLEKLTAVVRSILNGEMTLDEAMAVRQIRLVALAKRKPDGTYKGVRPVAMSETVLKIAAMVALARCEHLGSKWACQYGLRKGGVEPAIFRVTDGFRSGKRVRTFDASNAYNTVWRSAFFKELAMLDSEEVESLKAYANFAYGSASWATYEDVDGSLKRFYVERGVRQGDPGGALFFCMAIQPILMKVSDKFAGIEVLAYMDDIAFVADKTVSDKTFEEAAKMLIDEMAKIGLVLRTEHDTKGNSSPFRYLGGAVTKTSQETNDAVTKLRPLNGIDRVLEVLTKCDTQIAFDLLRVCGIAKGGFVARVHGEEAKGWLGEFDNKVLDFMSTLLQIGTNQLDGSKHLRQSTKFGGQGIMKWSTMAATCHAAARAMQPMWKMSLPATVEEIAALAESTKGHVSAIAMAAVENPLKDDQWVAIKKLNIGVPHNTRATVKDAGNDLPCMGCKKLFADADKLTAHAIQCPQASGEGNVTRRHNAARDAILRQARKFNKLARREVPIVCLGRDGKQHTLYGDVVINDHFCIDVTVTNKPVDRLYDKVNKYQDAVNNKSMKFHVLAFTPEGRIHKYSLGFAQKLAKSCGMPFSDFWAPVATEVIRGTAQAIIETSRFVSDIAERNRQNQAAAAVSHQGSVSTLPAPLPTNTTALVVNVNSVVGAAAVSSASPAKKQATVKPAAISVPPTTNTNAQGVAAASTGSASTTAPAGAAGATK